MYKQLFEDFLTLTKGSSINIEFGAEEVYNAQDGSRVLTTKQLLVNGMRSVSLMERSGKEEESYKSLIHNLLLRGAVHTAIGQAGMYEGSEGEKYRKSLNQN